MSKRNQRTALFGLIILTNILAPALLQRDGSTIIWTQWNIFFLGCTICLDITLALLLREAGLVVPHYLGLLAVSALIVLAFGIGKLAQDGVFERLAVTPVQQVAVAATPIPATAIPATSLPAAPTSQPAQANNQDGCDPDTVPSMTGCVANVLGGALGPLMAVIFGIGIIRYMAGSIKQAMR